MIFTESLKKNYQFRIVYNKGKSVADKNLVLYVLKNGKNINKLGISVSKKVGNSVIRSKVKRLIKESYRLNEQYLKKGYDIVVIARINSKEKEYQNIFNSFVNLCKKHKIYYSKK